MIVRTAKQHDAQTLYLLQSVPGIGKILRLVLLYAIHDSTRFPRVQDVVSSCRLVTCAKEAAGKRGGTARPKIGHAYLPRAFSAAAGPLPPPPSCRPKALAPPGKKKGTGQAPAGRGHE